MFNLIKKNCKYFSKNKFEIKEFNEQLQFWISSLNWPTSRRKKLLSLDCLVCDEQKNKVTFNLLIEKKRN